jgi:hypothetical protein
LLSGDYGPSSPGSWHASFVTAPDLAVELPESGVVLEKPGENLNMLRDVRYFTANVMKNFIGRDLRFELFLSTIRQAHSVIQPAALAQFIPPTQTWSSP